jgi:alkylhydroperoxidase family enzyme
MARVPYLDQADLPAEYQQFLKRPISLFRGLANSPGALQVHHEFGEWVRWSSKLEPKLREHIILLVGLMHKSKYEVSHHIQIAMDSFGVSEAEIWDLIAYLDGRPTEFSPASIAALNLARELVQTGKHSDETWGAAAAHFSNEELTDITVIAAFYVYVVLVLAGLEIDVEPDYFQYLEKFNLQW